MTSFTLVRNPHSRGKLNLNGLVPDRLLSLSPKEIASLPIETETGTATTLANHFTLHDGERDRLVLQGDLRDCDYVAGDMQAGELVIAGHVGDFLARGMRGGRVVVTGNAGSYACSSLRGGQVTIQGDVGKYAAAAPPGGNRGMAGGELFINGSADQFLGSRLRRGRVIVRGRIASGCASRMIAGTIVACDRVDQPLGYGMLRGTLLLLRPEPHLLAHSLPGFTELAPCELSFLPLLIKDLIPHLPPELSGELADVGWLRGVGDRAAQGYGEIFVPRPDPTSLPAAEP